ncbi:MAG TPA: PfkB family carbohydrate kinase [Polyangiaceae bacterium]
MIDVYLYGMISPSTVHVLRDDFSFPRPNAYAEIAKTLPSIGGEAANSAIILAKFGLTTKLDGNWIRPEHAAHVLGLLTPFGIDLTRLTFDACGGTLELVISDQSTRTVFGHYATFHAGPRQWNEPRPEDIAEARMVCIDPYFREQSVRAAELCVEARKPYVTLDSRFQDFMAQEAAAVVISHELRDQAYRGVDHGELFESYLVHCRGLVIFTFGERELWFARRGNARQTFRPFSIKPVDTAGAGDAFRGAIAYGLLNQWSDHATVEFASAVAACVCQTTPHTLQAPDLAGVKAFLRAAQAPQSPRGDATDRAAPALRPSRGSW